MIYKWISIESFNAWHNEIMALKAIPNENTLIYTQFYVVNDSDIRALVREEDIDLCPNLIGVPSEAIIKETI